MITLPQTIEDIAANREAWAVALESGTYKQCTGRLSLFGAYCVNGVLCHLYDPANELHWRGGYYLLPEIAAAVGLHRPLPGQWRPQYHGIASLNDNGLPFPRLAQRIRNLPLPLEVLS